MRDDKYRLKSYVFSCIILIIAFKRTAFLSYWSRVLTKISVLTQVLCYGILQKQFFTKVDFMSFISLLQAAGGSGSMLMSVLPFGLIIIIFYFFIIRPQNKKQKETEKMLSSLKKGDKIVTIGGIHGVISSTKEKTVIVKVDDNTKIEFSRNAVSTVVSDKVEKDEKSDKDEKKSSKTEDVPASEAKEETSSEENK